MVAATARLARPTVVAVDGVDGSGKTTFADRLADAYTAHGRAVHVVHMDDFLNPRSTRYRLGRNSPEGYFLDTYDIGAFTAKVLDPLRSGAEHVMVARTFDHHADEPVADNPIPVGPHAVVIVEGMFLHRDELVARWDLSIFLDVPFTVSVQRVAQRDGTPPDPTHPSLSRYVAGQRLYLARCRPAERATYVISNC